MRDVQVSYLTMMSGPTLWGSVGSIVTDPGNGRYVILRQLDPEKGPDGYLVVDLVKAEIYRGFAREKDARDFVRSVA